MASWSSSLHHTLFSCVSTTRLHCGPLGDPPSGHFIWTMLTGEYLPSLQGLFLPFVPSTSMSRHVYVFRVLFCCLFLPLLTPSRPCHSMGLSHHLVVSLWSHHSMALWYHACLMIPRHVSMNIIPSCPTSMNNVGTCCPVTQLMNCRDQNTSPCL